MKEAKRIANFHLKTKSVLISMPRIDLQKCFQISDWYIADLFNEASEYLCSASTRTATLLSLTQCMAVASQKMDLVYLTVGTKIKWDYGFWSVFWCFRIFKSYFTEIENKKKMMTVYSWLFPMNLLGETIFFNPILYTLNYHIKKKN